MAKPGTEKDWTESQKRNDWPLQKREAERTDGSGPDMWPTKEEGKR